MVRPNRFVDHRGFFVETYNLRDYKTLGIHCQFVQDNFSVSENAGTIRGLHFQRPPHSQAKLVRAQRGAIFDVAVDLRRGSPTFARWCAATVTADGGEQIFIPRGFAHAFVTLEPGTEVVYKADEYYDPDCEAGVIWNDPDIAIDWPEAAREPILSEKDSKLPRLAELETLFTLRATS